MSEKKILVIEDSLSHYDIIKESLEPLYKIIPEENFKSYKFLSAKKLYISEIKPLLMNHKDELIGIILDANLHDHMGDTEDMSGINDILPAIRNEGDIFSIIPIIIFTKYSEIELKKDAFYNLANYFIVKSTGLDLKHQVETEIRWMINSLGRIYQVSKKRLLHQPYVIDTNEILKDMKEIMKDFIKITSYNSKLILEVLGSAINYSQQDWDGQKNDMIELKIEIVIYMLMNMIPKSKAELVREIIQDIETSKNEIIRQKLTELQRSGKWDEFKEKLKIKSLEEIPTILVSFGTKIFEILINHL